MIGEVKGKVALVTGAASGIGLGIAKACAIAGMKVALADIDQRALADAVVALSEDGAEVLAVDLDVADPLGWERAITTVDTAFGPVRLLCNNAGISVTGLPFANVGPEIWNQVMRVNLDSMYFGIHACLDTMITAGGGHIVNTSSLGGLFGGATTIAPYAATKAAAITLSECLREELAPLGIGVSVLIPGGVRSNIWKSARRLRGLPELEVAPDDVSGQSARAARDPDDVGRMVLTGVREDAPYIFTDCTQTERLRQRFDRILAASASAEDLPASDNE
jgi:NAD(P)-dependent dehydrogenase (short-subunit alcohol dehydrogenase family)